MKKFAAISVAAIVALASSNAMAFFDSKNKWEEPECWYNPYDCNPYDEWDPRYWMEEMEQMWDDDNDGPFGGMPYGMPYGGGAPMMPYGMPYGQPMMPQGQPMAPGMRAPAMPYGQPMPRMPMMPYGAPAPMPAPAAPAAPAQAK